MSAVRNRFTSWSPSMLFVAASCAAALLAFPDAVRAQRAPGESDPVVVRAQIARLQVELAQLDGERARIAVQVNDALAQLDRLRAQQSQLDSEKARRQGELMFLQQQLH